MFSNAGPDACFGWGGWNLDQTADVLVAAGQMREVILVAVNNGRFRYQEYRGPEKAGASKSKTAAGRFENYARFLTRELKPRIDRTFRTRPGPAHTGVMGSSLGGICSLALAWEQTNIFGLAASLSGSFQIEGARFLKTILRKRRAGAKPFRVYLDSGVIDHGGDDDGRELTTQVAAELRRIGWRDGRNLLHHVAASPLTEAELERSGLRRDKWGEARTSQHNEFYWRLRAGARWRFCFHRAGDLVGGLPRSAAVAKPGRSSHAVTGAWKDSTRFAIRTRCGWSPRHNRAPSAFEGSATAPRPASAR